MTGKAVSIPDAMPIATDSGRAPIATVRPETQSARRSAIL